MEKVLHHAQFMTATIKKWKHLLKPDKYKIIVLQILKQLVHDNKIILYAYCVMDNHIHLIWQITGDHNPAEVRKSFFESTAKSFKNDFLPWLAKMFPSKSPLAVVVPFSANHRNKFKFNVIFFALVGKNVSF
jgi:REP element-mobilizing transposase RayT